MTGTKVFTSSLALSMAVLLASCTVTPRSGPSHRAIAADALESVKAKPGTAYQYAFIDITKSILPLFDDTILDSLSKGFGGGRGRAPELTLAVGDVLEVSIFEAQAGGLFIPEDAGSRPGNFVTLPRQTVDRSGMITVPYVGSVRAVGRPIAEVQSEIEKRLSNRAIEPQVVITTVSSRANTVAILGDVNQPAQLDLSPAGERLVDLIARAGGLTASQYETYVTVERRGRKARVLFRTLLEHPEENIYIRPGDTIFVTRERRTYLAFGASVLTGRLDFEDSNLTLGEAMAKSGGPLDNRADPSQVFLYRMVDRETLRKAGIDVTRFPSGMVPTVFRADLRDPSMFFAVQQFKMQDKDIIYVSNSDQTEIQKFLNLINDVSDTTANVPNNAVVTRNSVRRLTNN